ncbi:Protein HGV2 [Dirofilaria immitis]
MAPISRNDEYSNKQKDDEDVVKFQALLTEGKQAYISGRFKEAEIKLSEAAELSVSIYGYFTTPTFDPHLYYGKTLLELARLEDSVFSNALQGIRATGEDAFKNQNNKKDGDMEELESFTKNTGSTLEETNEVLEEKIARCRVDSSTMLQTNNDENRKRKIDHDTDNNETNVAMENDKGSIRKIQTRRDYSIKSEKNEDAVVDHKEYRIKIERKEKKNENMQDEKKEGKNKAENEEEKDDKLDDSEDGISEENDSKDGSSEAGDVEYLQLAWENLEVARAICDKHLEEEGWKEKKIEVLLDLTDCSTDAENYKQAIDDIDACIILMESIFDEVDRRIAQAYFIKGRTHNLARDFGNAAKVFKKSKQILEVRLAKLEIRLEHENDEEVEKIKKEIDELKSLLPEIQIKIDDSLESARSLKKKSVVADDDEEKVFLKSSIKEMPVDDVSNLESNEGEVMNHR